MLADVSKFCGSGESRLTFSPVSDLSFPRLVSIQNILHIIRGQPKLAKDAVSALVDAGEAIHQNATREEISVLIRATLAQEVYVRNACLQSLQVCASLDARILVST